MLTEGYSVRILLGWCGPPEPGRPRTVAAHTQTHCWAHTYTSTRKLMDSSKCCVGARESFQWFSELTLIFLKSASFMDSPLDLVRTVDI